MKWSVEKKTLAGLGFASIILVSINALAYWQLKQHKNNSHELIRRSTVLEKLQLAFDNLKNAETEQTLYIFTGKKHYLEDYLKATVTVQQRIKDLKKLTIDNNKQQQRLDILDFLVAKKLAELEKIIKLRKDKGLDAARQLVLTEPSKQITKNIYLLIQEMEAEHRTGLEVSIRKAQASNRQDLIIVAVGIILSLVLLYFVYYSIKGEIKALRKVELAQQKLNREISEALEREKNVNELKSRIISVISHEYRTPLTTILSSTELLQYYSHRWSDEKKNIHFQRIKLAVHQLTALVSDVLDINKAESGKIEFNPYPLNLELFGRQLVEEIQQNKASEYAINFVSFGNDCSGVADEKLLQQIFTNLLLNAIKYSPKNSTIYFELRCFEGKAIFQIRDEGIGISATDKVNLFKSFERGSNVGTISGAGLGLAIVKKLVDLHGGQITVDSVVGMGTTVTVILPIDSKIPALPVA
jgi:signal transduction histidine kinase